MPKKRNTSDFSTFFDPKKILKEQIVHHLDAASLLAFYQAQNYPDFTAKLSKGDN